MYKCRYSLKKLLLLLLCFLLSGASLAEEAILRFPTGVAEVEAQAYMDCAGITGVVLPKGLTEIGARAFAGCTGLTRVSLPDSVSFIGTDAFADCPAVVLYCADDSYAAQYAEGNGLAHQCPFIGDCAYYNQKDPRWEKIRYSTHSNSQTIGSSGCGPTAMAMVLATWYDGSVTPVETAALALKQGYRTYNSGTAWGFYRYCYNKYPCFSGFVQTDNLGVLKAALANGAIAVCSVNANDNHFWTAGGHFIVAVGHDGKYIYANDPNKWEYPRRQLLTRFSSCLKQAFIFYRK